MDYNLGFRVQGLYFRVYSLEHRSKGMEHVVNECSRDQVPGLRASRNGAGVRRAPPACQTLPTWKPQPLNVGCICGAQKVSSGISHTGMPRAMESGKYTDFVVNRVLQYE